LRDEEVLKLKKFFSIFQIGKDGRKRQVFGGDTELQHIVVMSLSFAHLIKRV
jgi:hypothetical protein